MRNYKWIIAVAGTGLLILATVALWPRGEPAAPSGGGSGAAVTPVTSAVAASGVEQPLGALGKIATPRGKVVEATIGPEGGVVSMEDGAKLQVPAGAITKPTRISVAAMDLNVQRFAFEVSSSLGFVVSADAEIPKLDPPLVLEIPWDLAKRPVGVGERTGGAWKARPSGPGGDAVRIEINHFSKSVFGVLEWFSDGLTRINRVSDEANPLDTVKFERNKVETFPDPNVQAFFGVGEHATRGHHDYCDEFKTMLRAFGSKENLKFPSERHTLRSPTDPESFQALGLFLHSAKVPKDHGGYYFEATKDSMPKIHEALMAFSGQASPAEYLKICIVANGNNVPLGVLAAHNYLKEVTYFARDTWDGKNKMPPESGQAASKLAPWRADPIAAGGYYDKMGPLYHIFAAMTAATWGYGGVGELDLGLIAVEGEAMLRALKVGADMPDVPKGIADDCGLSIGNWIIVQLVSDPTRMPRTFRRDRMTMVELVVDDLAAMNVNDLPFRLYRGPTPEGPWTYAGGQHSKSIAGSFTSPIEATGATIVIGDRFSNGTDDPQPPCYRIARVVGADIGKEEETFSAVVTPSRPRIWLRSGHEGFAPITGVSFTNELKDPGISINEGYYPWLLVTAVMELTDQAFKYPNAHLTISWGGATWHAWSGRNEKDFTFGRERGEASLMLPARIGKNVLTIHAEGVGGGVADRSITVEFTAPWAAARRPLATAPVDEDQEVKRQLAAAEQAPAKAAALEKELAGEKNELRKSELRAEILRLENLALDLEESRFRVLLKRAWYLRDLTDYGPAAEMVAIWVQNYPQCAQRRLAWVDKSIGWGELHKTSDAAERNVAYRASTVRYATMQTRTALAAGLTLARATGDYSAAKFYGTRLITELSAGPNEKLPSGWDLTWVKEQFALATAELGGNRATAAAIRPEGRDKPEWWPDTAPTAPAPASAEEQKKIDDEFARRSAEAQKKLNLRLRPGEP